MARMSSPRRAIIDVGTNSVKLLVADIHGAEVVPLCEESIQTRLGHGFYETHRLHPDAIAHTARAIAEFAAKARHQQAGQIRVIATSAARDAANATELTEAVIAACGLPLEIISGEQEADWAFHGVTTDPALARVPLLLLDVGGGSTEFILGQGEEKHFRQSFRLGTVRLLQTIPPGNPPAREELAETRQWLRAFLRDKVRPSLVPALEREIQRSRAATQLTLVGTGGTTTILARMEASLETYDRAMIENTRLSLERLRWHVEKLWSLPLAQREAIVGLPRKRADVILTGSAIFEAVMEEFGFAELRVSTRGLRFAAVLEAR